MSSFDIHSPLGYSTIASVTSQVSPTLIVVVQTGDGAKFAVNQQVAIWVQGAQPNTSNAMICRITAISGDTITLDYSTGNKEGTSTRTVLATDQISNTVTPKALTDIESIALTGWTPAGDTFTYASATSFTIAGVDRTTTYTKGTRIKFTNNFITVYGVVASSSFSTDTTVNLAPNADYAIANSAITAPYYSYAYNPQGYPGWFNFATSWTGFSANPTGNSGNIRFRVDGNMCTIDNMGVGNGTSNTAALTFSVPITLGEVGGGNFFGTGVTFDNSAYQIYCGSFYLNGTTVNCYKNTNQVGGWTSSGSKMLYAYFSYPI